MSEELKAAPLTSQLAAGQPLASIAYGHQSHDWMASKVRMLMRDDLDHEAVCTGARDRIVWMAARIAALEGALRFYSDPVLYTNAALLTHEVHGDRGETARAALTEGKP